MMRGSFAGAALLVLVACERTAAEPRDALTAGWVPQYDAPDQAAEPGRFVEHPDAVELRAGPNVNLWHPAWKASGDFRLAADVVHLDPGDHPHGAGLTFGGTGEPGTSTRHSYFLIRDDRHFLIKTRDGDKYPELVPWRQHDAAAGADEQGVTRNHLAIEARGDTVRFLVNGTEVHRAPRTSLPVDGAYGLRLVHDTHARFGKPRLEGLE